MLRFAQKQKAVEQGQRDVFHIKVGCDWWLPWGWSDNGCFWVCIMGGELGKDMRILCIMCMSPKLDPAGHLLRPEVLCGLFPSSRCH